MPVPCCGPKLSMCGVLLSIWGVVMLGLLGVFFRIRAVGLFEDLPFDEETWKDQGFKYDYIEKLYTDTSTNCFIATGIYGGLFIFSLIMWNVNKRVDYNMS